MRSPRILAVGLVAMLAMLVIPATSLRADLNADGRDELGVFAVEVTGGGAEITGLCTDSPRIRSSRLLIKFEMCQKLDERRNACVGPVSKVAWSEPRISVWNQWQNLRGGDEVAWSWIAPDGTNVSRLAHQVEESPPFDYRTWSYIEPAKLEVESPYGTWTVTVELNDEERELLRFEVVRGEAGS